MVKDKEEKERYSIEDIATQTAPVIKDNKENKQLTETMSILADILNKLDKIEKALEG